MSQRLQGVGYFETVFSAVEMSTMAEALKQFSLDQHVTKDSQEGEVLNSFISALVKTIDLEGFSLLASQLFKYDYPIRKDGSVKVESVRPTEAELRYLKQNIELLLQKDIEVA